MPGSWPSGLYRLKAHGPGETVHTDVLEFVVRAAAPGSTSKILLVADFVTPHAYHGAGGESLYASPSGRGSTVSFNRPLGPLGGHRELIVWLNTNGHALEYASLVDLHVHTGILDAYQCLLFGPHTEYWTKEMRDQVEAFVQRGGNVMSLSGNTCYRQVRLTDNARTLIGYKNAKADPDTDLQRQTVAFAQPPVNRPPNTMLGVGWTHGAFRGYPPPAAAYTVHFPNHGPALVRRSARAIRRRRSSATKPTRRTSRWLFCATSDNRLWRRHPVLAEIVWRPIGHANTVTAMAGTRGLLFAVTADNTLWSRWPVEADIDWTPAGSGPPGGARALCASGSTLYAIRAQTISKTDTAGQLLSRPASRTTAIWTTVASMPPNATIVAMTSYNGVLFASTSGNRLLRTGFDFIEESRAWVDIHHCNYSRALAVVDGMLFVATTENRLWWLDLRHGALDTLSAEV